MKACGNPEDRPGLLVSYVYLESFLNNCHRYHYRDWAMDSGAFSAHNSGADIPLGDYIDTCKRLSDDDRAPVEIYALDVIGDWKASLRNTEAMWSQGVRAIPCYHVDEPESVLRGMARDYPKIAIGGVALAHAGRKLRWAEQCFSRVWPARIHGFAFASERALLSLPFDSVDSSSWEIGPCGFGIWKAYQGESLRIRGGSQNLRVEVDWYLRLEERARGRWSKVMAAQGRGSGPTVRLALADMKATPGRRQLTALGPRA